MIYGDEYLDGLALCLETYRELQNLDLKHELLKFGTVRPEDDGCNFFLADESKIEFEKRFAKDGVHPVGHNACCYALARYAAALIKVVDEKKGRGIEKNGLVEKTESTIHQNQTQSDIPF